MPNMWFTSDHHFGHRNIARLAGRPFPDTDDGVHEMNETMVDAWNTAVAAHDDVFVLGDFALGKIADTLGIVDRLNGNKYLIAGNHDRCSPAYYKTPSEEKVAAWHQKYLDAGFDLIGQSGTIGADVLTAVTPNSESVLLHHFPYTGDSHYDDRYTDHRPVDEGGWLIHGHVHEAWRQRGRQINVGVDAWAGSPVPIETIAEMIAAGEQNIGPLDWK